MNEQKGKVKEESAHEFDCKNREEFREFVWELGPGVIVIEIQKGFKWKRHHKHPSREKRTADIGQNVSFRLLWQKKIFQITT